MRIWLSLGFNRIRLGKRGKHPGVDRRPFVCVPPGMLAAPRARQAVIDKMKRVFEKEAAAVGKR